MIDDFTAIKKLKLAFRAALRRARKASRSLFLDIFSGSGAVSTALAGHGYAVLSIDLLLGEQFDVLRKAAETLIVGWIRNGSVLGVFMAVDCKSWTVALHGPPGSNWCALRNRDFVFGLPDLPDGKKAQVMLGNALCHFCCRVVQICLDTNTPVGLENPDRSFLFQVPRLQALLKKGCSRTTDFCQHSARWRKRTRFLFWNLSPSPSLSLRCTGRKGFCSNTGKPHIELTGRDAVSKRLWTALAQPYPSSLARAVADCFVQAAESNRDAAWHSVAIVNAMK